MKFKDLTDVGIYINVDRLVVDNQTFEGIGIDTYSPKYDKYANRKVHRIYPYLHMDGECIRVVPRLCVELYNEGVE